MLLQIRSMRIEKHVKRIDERLKDVVSYIFNCKFDDKKYELVIEENEERLVQVFLNEVKMFSGISYLTKEKMEIEFEPNQNGYDNSLFKIDNSRVQIKYENLIPTNRAKVKRPVWIFVGESALGKSYLSSVLANGSNNTKYETDSSPELPLRISEDMIVVGNKYHFSLRDIKERIHGEHETIIVNFEKDE